MDSSCCTNPGAKQTHQSQGYEEEIAEVNTYKTGQGKSAIIVFTDVFGFSFPNTRKVADRFAEKTGTTVFIPDYFYGDPMDINVPNFQDLLPAWKEKHPVTDACATASKFISTIKEHYQSIQVKLKVFFNNIIYYFFIGNWFLLWC
jgi:dienelactone hydrolase